MLPTINHPIEQIQVPSMGCLYRFRPFLTKEEKILLIAKQSGKINDIMTAILQIIANCALDTAFPITCLTSTDVTFLFLKLRAFSVNNIVSITYEDNEDKKSYKFKVDLNDVNIKKYDNHNKTIKIDDTTGIVLKDLPHDIKLYEQKNEADFLFTTIKMCLDKVYVGDEIFNFKDYTDEEIDEFLNSLPINTMEKFKEFIATMPEVYYEINYTNSNGTERKIVLNKLDDFFILR